MHLGVDLFELWFHQGTVPLPYNLQYSADIVGSIASIAKRNVCVIVIHY
jgi:hypothetical protein